MALTSPLPLRQAVRSLGRRPAFSALAITILALGIGANGTVFSLLDATILRPLPFPAPERLVDLTMTVPPERGEPGRDDMVWSYPKYRSLATAQRSFQFLATWRREATTLLTDAGAVRLSTEAVGGDYFRTLGIAPVAGRDFDRHEDQAPSAERVAVVGHGFWQSHLGGRRDVLGTILPLGDGPATVIGVAPRGFQGLSGRAELWFNIASAGPMEVEQRWSHSHHLVGRLADGVAFPAALAEVELLGARVDAEHPSPVPGAAAWGAMARPLNAVRTDPVLRRTAVVLGVAVGLVLLIACVNLANLLLARALGRHRELAVCLAVGARPRHLVAALLAESAVLGVVGSVLGIGLTWAGVRGLGALWQGLEDTAAGQFGGLSALALDRIGMSPGVVAFLVAVSVLTTLLVGIAPALRASRASLREGLHGLLPVASVGRARLSLRDGLVIAQLGLAVSLLVGAGLMIRSMANLLARDPGVEAGGVASARIAIAPDSYQPDSAVGFYAHLIERARALPGVTHAAIGNCPPLSGGCNGTVIWFRDRPEVPEGEEPSVGVHHVSPGWFETLGVRLVRGRDFATTDRRGGPKVAIINETAARRFYPTEDPVGRPIAVGQGGFHIGSAEIIGVVSDVRFGTLEQEPGPDVFIPYLQAPRAAAILYLRTGGSPDALVGPLRLLIRELDPTLPVYDIRTLQDRFAVSTFRPRYTTWVMGLFAAAALALAAIGIYALLAYEVTQRRREIGIRMALGAAAGIVVRDVLRRGLLLALVGVAIGVPVAIGLSRFMGALLFGVNPGDPATYLVIVTVLVAVAAAATMVPARAAARVNPMEAIRTE